MGLKPAQGQAVCVTEAFACPVIGCLIQSLLIGFLSLMIKCIAKIVKNIA